MNATNGAERALSGVRVLDLTQFEAGPSCTEALAWLGAEVVKVENPKGGDPGRFASSESQGMDSYYFLLFNANKKSITVNLKSERGLELVKQLVAEADVFIENFAPGTIDRLGLGYDVVKAINPAIVYAQVKGFAEGSPFENFLSFDMIGQSVGGVLSITGEADGPPMKPGATIGDTGTGMLAAISILGALYQRKSSGEGQRIQIAMQDAMLQYTRIAYAVQAQTGKPAPRTGAKVITGGNAPSGIYPCAPGGPNDYVYIYTTRAGNHHWERLCKVVGREELGRDEAFATPKKRLERETEIDAMLSQWTQARSKREAMEILGAAGIPAGAVFDTAELHGDENMERRGVFQTIEHPTRGSFKMPAWPVKMSNSEVPLAPAPLLGQHAESVLDEWLSMSQEDIAALRSEGAI